MIFLHILADTPQWVVDAKNYLGFGGAVVAAFGLVWRYAIKPYLTWREEERKRAIADAAAVRKGEITVALIPVQEQLRILQTDVKSTGDKVLLQGDAIHGINNQINSLAREQRELHRSVRAHMDAEDAAARERDRQQGDGI